ncbi:MAG: 4Fe-4S binding protein [Oscillospiraceae bacterium]
MVDYAKCVGCGACVEGCPTKCLHLVNGTVTIKPAEVAAE